MAHTNDIVKDTGLLIDTKFSSNGRDTEYTLARVNQSGSAVRLSDVFNYIPSGHVIKSETGMGATTLELKALRNSIIVEPIRVTASSKAYRHDGSLYIGSPTSLHTKVTDEMIVAYCSDDSIAYKKILVVADSLPRLINVIDDKLFHDYFLMIDEIDSFQVDASFRSRMENCLDIYKRFPPTNRAIVSATTIDFSDPELREEKTTLIQYDNPASREIIAYCTWDIKAITVEVIQERLEKSPKDKIMVAYNSVTGCRAIADKLIAMNLLEAKDIKVLCSSNTKYEVENYYCTLENDKLPGRVSFFTSAYFSGFDLHEDYHLVSVSGNKSMFHALSEKRLKQIAGRCRQKLLSETIVYDIVRGNPRKYSRLNDLLEAAEKEISALKCIDKHYSSNLLLRDNLTSIREYILRQTNRDGHQYVRKHFFTDEYVPAYLSIDAYLESARVRKALYTEQMQLPDAILAQGNIISKYYALEEVEVKEEDTTKLLRQDMAEQAINAIKLGDNSIESFLNQKSIIPLQRLLVKGFLDYRAYFDNDQLLALLKEKASQRDTRGLKNFLAKAYFATMNESQHYKRNVRANLPFDVPFTTKELLARWKTIFLESGLNYSTNSLVAAVRLTKIHFKVKHNREDKRFTLKKGIPLKLKLNGERTIADEEAETINIYEAFVT